MVMYMNNGASLLKIVNGLSRTLNIANQMIPLYKQVKPVIANSGKILAGIKSLNTVKVNNSNNNAAVKINPEPITTTPNLNVPTFFQ